MTGNSFGHLFRVTTFGESHGPAIGCIVDGVPPRIPLQESDIQEFLDKRKPGQSKFSDAQVHAHHLGLVGSIIRRLVDD